MNDLYFAIVMFIFIGGLYYFSHKCMMSAVGRVQFFVGMLVFPVGAAIGIYWAIKDFFLFRNINSNVEVNPKSEQTNNAFNNNKSTLDELYLKALDEYESGSKDRALYARLYAENNGDEALVKAKYIKHRVELMS